ncbi:hypothetical protein [Stutzerimonas nitrititolerans]|uniref:hypothetical protein n=1 Tax=Stutzerimonas nitrititolerans TaxID=2482751 RepID=UPI0028994759|nr:hypothetical protein [Stutzerimonas nitrititolerans]
MNKQLTAILMATGFVFSASAAIAAPTAFQENVQVDNSACALLGEEITLGVSAKVHGAYACDEEENLVQVAACHEGGSRSQGVACTDTDPDTTGVQLPAGCENNATHSSIPSYKAFFTSSRGGVMQEQELGSRCGEGTIVGIKGFSS